MENLKSKGLKEIYHPPHRKMGVLVMAIFFAIVLSGCGGNSLDGKWKVVRAYSPGFPTEWRTDYGENDSIAFVDKGYDTHKSGTYGLSIKGDVKYGTYTLDSSIKPHRIILESEGDSSFGIYKIEGSKMTLKMSRSPNARAPADFGVEPDHEIIEFERATK